LKTLKNILAGNKPIENIEKNHFLFCCPFPAKRPAGNKPIENIEKSFPASRFPATPTSRK
jgi:hypothetical protein